MGKIYIYLTLLYHEYMEVQKWKNIILWLFFYLY